MREKKDNSVSQMKGLILYTIVLLIIGLNYKSVLEVAARCFQIMLPFLLGAAIAFVLNVPMRFVENKLKISEKSRLHSWKRPISLVAALAMIVVILGVVLFVVAPQLGETLISLTENIPAFFDRLQVNTTALFNENPQIVEYINQVEIDWKKTIEGIVNFVSVGAGTVLSSTLTAAMSIVSAVTTFGIGFIFAIYILLQKEELARQFKKLIFAYLPDTTAKEIVRIAVMAEKTFSKFLTGQCLEAVILGTMFFITLTAFKLPYSLLIGVLIAFTALIPVFGAFIGCAIGIFLTLIINPVQAILFTLIFFGLQQVEGNLIYPYVVGNSIGLPAIWVLVAVTVGGSAMGIVGMLLFIPLSSVAYALLREKVNARLKLKAEKAKEVKAEEK